MTLRDDLLPTVYAARAIAGELGFRQHTVAIVTIPREGTHTGDGSRDETVTDITELGGQPPRVRWAKSEDVAMGLVPKGFVTVGPITPEFSGGGTAIELLSGSDLETGDVRLLRITGPSHPNGADYTINDVTSDRALRFMITAVPVGTQVP
jgi:hypothetical protein